MASSMMGGRWISAMEGVQEEGKGAGDLPPAGSNCPREAYRKQEEG